MELSAINLQGFIGTIECSLADVFLLINKTTLVFYVYTHESISLIECFICEEPFCMKEIPEHQRLVHPDNFSPPKVS